MTNPKSQYYWRSQFMICIFAMTELGSDRACSSRYALYRDDSRSGIRQVRN